MKKALLMLTVLALLVASAGMVLAKDQQEPVVPFKGTVRANEAEPNNDCTQANPLTLGDPMLASIDPVGDVDWFEFNVGFAGLCVKFETQPGEGQVGGDTQMTLYASDCMTELEYDDDSGTGLYSLFEYTFDEAGTYYIYINEYGNNGVIGAYVLTADQCPQENGSRCDFLSICYDWDFDVSDHGFMGVPCGSSGIPVWQYGAEMTIPGAPGNVWATVLNGSYPNSGGEGLLSPPFLVEPGVCDWMEILQYVHTEWYSPTSPIYDGCNVTVDDVVIYPVEGYDGTASSAPNCVANEDVYAGNSASGPSRTWGRSCFDLSQYAGMTIQVRFDFGSDSSVQYPGWYLAYVKIGTTELPIEVESQTWGGVKSLYR
jgi:hypothetical protein